MRVLRQACCILQCVVSLHILLRLEEEKMRSLTNDFLYIPTPEEALPDDPALEEYKRAGWLG